MWFWYGFFGIKLYTIADILNMVKEDEVLYIDESEVIIKKGEKIIKRFEIHNPYGRKDCYTYVERES